MTKKTLALFLTLFFSFASVQASVVSKSHYLIAKAGSTGAVKPAKTKKQPQITKKDIDSSMFVDKKENKIMESQSLQEVEKSQKTNEDPVVLLKTDKGNFKIKLFLKDAPITAGNFLDLVRRKFYDGLTFHRIIPGFVVQGGCPLGNGTGSFIDPETKKVRYIKHEAPASLRHNKAGIVAMARTSDPDSASCQFFIDLAPQPSLDPGGVDPHGYAVFGEVIEGMDTINKIVEENVPPYPGSDGSSNPVKIQSARVVD